MIAQKLLGPAVALAILGLAAPAMAQDQGQAEEQTMAAAQQSRNELICVTEPVTGSRIPVRTCRTQAQIDEERERGIEFIERDTQTFDQTWPPTQ